MSAPRVLINALSMTQGGGRSYITNLLRELGGDDRGFRFTLLASPGQLDGIDPCGIEVRWVRLPTRQRVLWRVAFEELWMPLMAARFDLLYCVADLSPRFAAAPTVVLLRNLNIYDRRWYDDAPDRLPLCGTHGQTRIPVALGHGVQRIFSHTDDGRQGHVGQQ